MKSGARPVGTTKKKYVRPMALGDATTISVKELGRWNRALKRIRKEIVAETKRFTPEEIAALYPDGYPMDRLNAARQTTGVNERKKRGRRATGSLAC